MEVNCCYHVMGAILTAFYQWRRDLVSNMFGHFLVDSVANVLPAMLHDWAVGAGRFHVIA